MQCPFCHHSGTKVVDSRTAQEFVIRRRRECLSCGQRFTTKERVEEQPVRVVKKSGSREPYHREKLRQGLLIACSKRPVSDQQIELMVKEIENDLLEDGTRELPTGQIGQRVEQALLEVDQIAYFRFRTIHREIDDLESLAEELNPIRRGGGPGSEQGSLFR